MEKKGISLLCGFIFALLLSSALVSALGTELICLRENEKIEFSQCNPNIDDWTCTKTLCQLCVNEIRTGVYCPESINSCNAAGQSTCNFIYNDSIDLPEEPPEDVELPVITLLTPIDNYQREEGAINFKFSATLSYQLELCDLVINGQVVGTKNAPIRLSSNTIAFSLEEGEYDWKIKCITRDSYGNYIVESATRNLIVGDLSGSTESYKIELASPTGGWSAAGTQNVSFNYRISQDVILSSIESCSLILNEAVVSTTNDIVNYENSFIYAVSPASYSWSIFCEKGLNDLNSEIRNFTITQPQENPPAQQSSGDSGGGGGGGGGSYYRTYSVTNKQASEGYTKELKENDKIKFALINNNKTEQHIVSVKKVLNNSATLIIQSDPIETTLNIGENKKFDLTKDNYYDLLVRLNSISNSKANLTIQTINEKIEEETTETTEEEIEENVEDVETESEVGGITGAVVGVFNKSRIILATVFLIIIVVAAVMISYYKRGKGK